MSLSPLSCISLGCKSKRFQYISEPSSSRCCKTWYLITSQPGRRFVLEMNRCFWSPKCFAVRRPWTSSISWSKVYTLRRRCVVPKQRGGVHCLRSPNPNVDRVGWSGWRPQVLKTVTLRNYLQSGSYLNLKRCRNSKGLIRKFCYLSWSYDSLLFSRLSPKVRLRPVALWTFSANLDYRSSVKLIGSTLYK